MSERTIINRKAALVPLLALLLAAGCATGRQTGALAGAGLGALGGAILGDTEGALIGAAVGTGIGYIIGDQVDRRKAHDLNEAHPDGRHEEVGDLGGTRWLVTSIEPEEEVPAFRSKIVEFKNNGQMITTTTLLDGDVAMDRENYRVVGDKLIINKPGYIVNATYRVRGNELTITADEFKTVLRRL